MIVIDASVIAKWINKSEEDSRQALQIYKDHLFHKQKIIVPGLVFLEIANFLATKTHTTPKTIKKNLRFLFNVDLVIDDTREDIVKASILAKKYKTSVYDMLYAVVAKRRKTDLVTADSRFIQKTRFPFVKNLSD